MSATQLEELTAAGALEEKILTRQAKVGIVGLGYGGPLAVEFAKAGFDVTGIDLSDSKDASTLAIPTWAMLPTPTRGRWSRPASSGPRVISPR